MWCVVTSSSSTIATRKHYNHLTLFCALLCVHIPFLRNLPVSIVSANIEALCFVSHFIFVCESFLCAAGVFRAYTPPQCEFSIFSFHSHAMQRHNGVQTTKLYTVYAIEANTTHSHTSRTTSSSHSHSIFILFYLCCCWVSFFTLTLSHSHSLAVSFNNCHEWALASLVLWNKISYRLKTKKFHFSHLDVHIKYSNSNSNLGV